MHANSNRTVSDIATCDGDFEVFLVAVKPGDQYRKKGIAERLLNACEEALKGKFTQDLAWPAEKAQLRIMLKVVREINGKYWLRKGFRIMGECYCPPFTWDLEKAFSLGYEEGSANHININRARDLKGRICRALSNLHLPFSLLWLRMNQSR